MVWDHLAWALDSPPCCAAFVLFEHSSPKRQVHAGPQSWAQWKYQQPGYGTNKKMLFSFLSLLLVLFYLFLAPVGERQGTRSLFSLGSQKENHCLLSGSCSLLWLSFPTQTLQAVHSDFRRCFGVKHTIWLPGVGQEHLGAPPTQ